jgi:hypothetical protein
MFWEKRLIIKLSNTHKLVCSNHLPIRNLKIFV